MEQAFYFSTDARSRKARNIEVGPSVIVHLESGDEVVILECEARAVDEGSLIQRLSTEYFAKCAVRLEAGRSSR
jgi:general stress protein 26